MAIIQLFSLCWILMHPGRRWSCAFAWLRSRSRCPDPAGTSQAPENGRLRTTLAVGVCQPQEVQQIWVPEDEIRSHQILLRQGLQLLSGQLLRLAGDGRALIKHALDLLARESSFPFVSPMAGDISFILSSFFMPRLPHSAAIIFHIYDHIDTEGDVGELSGHMLQLGI
jgi:hypothetical protein